MINSRGLKGFGIGSTSDLDIGMEPAEYLLGVIGLPNP